MREKEIKKITIHWSSDSYSKNCFLRPFDSFLSYLFVSFFFSHVSSNIFLPFIIFPFSILNYIQEVACLHSYSLLILQLERESNDTLLFENIRSSFALKVSFSLVTIKNEKNIPRYLFTSIKLTLLFIYFKSLERFLHHFINPFLSLPQK